MTENLKQLRKHVTEIMAIYKPLLLVAGITESAATVEEKKYEAEIPEGHFLEAIKFLSSLDTDIKELARIYNHLEPHIWEHYKDMGYTDMHEQILLEKIAVRIRKAWRERPILLTTRTIPHGEKLAKQKAELGWLDETGAI